jgi:hypothetical protein
MRYGMPRKKCSIALCNTELVTVPASYCWRANHFGATMELRTVSLGLFVATFLLSLPVTANAAPSQLYNKSVELFWGESFMSKRVLDGTPSNGVGKKSRVIYISSAGRAFVKTSDSSGKDGSTREKGPEDNKGNVSFSGNQLSLVAVNKQIARRIVVSFDPSFSSCSATLSIGKASANARSIGYDGQEYEVISISGGAVNCSVKQGNALGAQ